jgi:hypothetical protein
LCRQAANNALDAWTIMRRSPIPRAESPRQARLKGALRTSRIGDKVLDHWQIEITGAGRIWYLVDPDKATVWVDYAGPGHPKATD